MVQATWRSIAFALMIPISSAAFAFEPPQRYDHPPKMPVKITRVEHVPELCRDAMQEIGCAFISKGTCWIVIARKLPVGWYKGVLRHEAAHCNGWASNHPD